MSAGHGVRYTWQLKGGSRIGVCDDSEGVCAAMHYTFPQVLVES
jgi:hypothetical protein